jgi:hypothetical protein
VYQKVSKKQDHLVVILSKIFLDTAMRACYEFEGFLVSRSTCGRARRGDEDVFLVTAAELGPEKAEKEERA